MNYTYILENMKSVRDYKKNPIPMEKINAVLEFGKGADLPYGSQLAIHFIEKGEAFFKVMNEKAGYFGKMIEAPHYIAVTGKPTRNTTIDAGYVTEIMRFQCKNLELGTCWLHTDGDEESSQFLPFAEGEKILGLLSVGESYSGFFKKDIQGKSSRESVAELVYMDTWGEEAAWEDLEQRGICEEFHLARLAPSWGNLQPWRFLIYKDKLAIVIQPTPDHDFYTETGIVMAYVEKAFIAGGMSSMAMDKEAVEVLAKEVKVGEGFEIRGVYQL